MKKVAIRTATSSLSFIFVSLFFSSCVSVSKFSNDTYAARDKDRKSFVQTKDGVITEAADVRLRSPLIGKSTIQLDNDIKIPVKDVLAYQNNTAYYRSINGQFAPRISKGLINMYMTTQTYTEFATSPTGRGGTRTRVRYDYWLQKGDKADVVSFSPEVTEGYVSDYAPAMEYINAFYETRKKVKRWSLINTTAVLGGLFLATQGVNNNKLNTAGYASMPLFFGGFVNGFVNKIRKGKNYRNLQLAVNEYNYQVKRKK